MIGHELAVEQGEVADFQPRDEPRQRGLRGVGGAAEHRFAEESAPEANAVDPADEKPVLPAFDRMGVTGGVEAERRALDIGVDPSLRTVGAALHHGMKIAVDGDRKLT